MPQSYTDNVLSLPYPLELYNVGTKWLVEWEFKRVGNPVNHEFLSKLKEDKAGADRLFSTYTESQVRKSSVKPALFIFHVSRCGSTLAANYLATDSENRVFNEPHLLSNPLRHLGTNSQQTENFERLINTLSLGALEEQKRLILKLSSHYLAYLPWFNICYPDVPKWLIVRNPVEVLASNIINPPRHILKQINGGITEEKCIQLVMNHWGHVFQQTTEYKESFDRIVDYTHLKNEISIMERELWKLSRYAKRSQLITKVFDTSSKRKRQFFKSDTAKKQNYKSLFKTYDSSALEEMENNYELLNPDN